MNKWKEASSLIISAACKNQISSKTISKQTDLEKYKFEILSLKKMGCGSTGSPRVCVFPGGTFSVADSVQEWETHFSTFGLSLDLLSSSIGKGNISKLPIFDNKGEDIPRWLSLRIAAIRETFEECGILLCKNKATRSATTKKSFYSSHFEIDGIEAWRANVLNDPFQFLSLCKKYQCYPDVENLLLWSNWLTPSHLPDRFDAVFFVTCMDTSALFRGSPDYKEIASTQWLKPEDLLKLSDKSKIWLKPPQWYEINKLLKMKELSFLEKYSQRNIMRWMPVRIVASDGEISLLPDDEMYPNEVDLFQSSPIFVKQGTMASLRCKKMHRMEHLGVTTTLLDTRLRASL